MRLCRGPRVIVALVLTVVTTLAFAPAAWAGPKSVGQEVRLQLLAVNDFHGQLEAYSATLGGAAMLGGYLNQHQAVDKRANNITWRLGVGDLIGASPAASGLLQDEPTLAAFDRMKFMFSAVGNHEFDEGLSELLRLQYGGWNAATGMWPGMHHMQYLAANVIRTDTGKTIFPPYAIKYARGIPVGIIGVVYQGTPSIVTASGVKGLTFLDEAATVNKYVAELHEKGVHAIIVLLHNGGSQTPTIGVSPITGDVVPVVTAMDPDVDVVLSGHSHNKYWGYIGTKLVTGAHSAGRAFADVDLVLDRKTGDVKSKTAEIVVVDRNNASIKPDPKVNKIVLAAVAKVAPIVNQVIGTASVALTRTQNSAGESTLGDLIADAQKWKGGTQVAITNPGGIRTDLAAGTVTWGNLFAIQPFSNYLVTMKMTGAQLKTALEQQWGQTGGTKMLQISGLTYSWSTAAPAGSKVDATSMMIGTAAVDPDGIYTVTANNFLAEGGDSFAIFKSATDKIYGGTDLDALVAYVKQLAQPFGAPTGGRVTVLP